MDNKGIEEISKKIMDMTRKRGIKDIKVIARRHRDRNSDYREGKLEKLGENTTCSLNLCLYDQGKYGQSTINDFRPQAIESFLDKTIAMTRAMQPDPDRELTDPSLYANRNSCDLKLENPQLSHLSIDRIKEMALETERHAAAEAGDSAASSSGGMNVSEDYCYRLYSNGFEGRHQEDQTWLYAEVSLKDKDGKKPNGDGFCGARNLQDLSSPASIGKEAVARAHNKLGAEKTETHKGFMLLENRVAYNLMNKLVHAMLGNEIQQQQSFLTGKEKGTQIASPLLSFRDEPFLPGAWGSRHYDADGISSHPMDYLKQGVIENYLIDYYYGKKLKMPPTTGWYSNLVVEPGDKSPDQLIADIPAGIMVTGFMGGNSNGTTGDFSFGISGMLIEQGKITRPVTEMNISGNHKTFWNQLKALGNDPWPFSPARTPSMLFDGVQFSGN